MEPESAFEYILILTGQLKIHNIRNISMLSKNPHYCCIIKKMEELIRYPACRKIYIGILVEF